MVNNDQLEAVFHALADPTRRRILEQLTDGTSKVSALAEPHAMSAPLLEVRDWISVYADHWHQRFDTLDEQVLQGLEL